jgi:hypothetical protein
VLYGECDRLAEVAYLAEHLDVCNETEYRLCEPRELAHVRIVNSIRIRPNDFRALLERQTVGRELSDAQSSLRDRRY